MKLDLHMHTKFSDGSDSVEEILKKAENLGLKYISITDHDNCKVYKEIENVDIAKYYSGKIIPGVELQAYILGISIELLGYFVDYNKINEKVKNLYKKFEVINLEELKRLYNKCIDVGMKFDENILENYQNSGYYYATEYLHTEMKKNIYNKQFVPDEESWNSESVFFKRHTSNINSKFYIDESDLIPSVGEVIKIIKEANGLVFVPHIFQYEENSIKILDELLDKYEIDGLECYYSTFTEEQTDYLLKICEEKNKLISGGSDYHGKNRSNTFLGKATSKKDIDDINIEKWIKSKSGEMI